MFFLVLNHLDEKEGAGCFAFIVFWMSCCRKYPMALPRGALSWSAVCDCGISCLTSSVFFYLKMQGAQPLDDKNICSFFHSSLSCNLAHREHVTLQTEYLPTINKAKFIA